MYEWILHDLGKWGWLAAFVYCTCAALRLARFNANIGVVDKRFFQGLPSPAAAALIAGFVWLVIDNKLPVKELWMPWVAFGITLYAGLSMVSNAPFYSGKALDVRYRVPFGMMVLVLVLFVLVSTDPPVALFALFVAYAISGYVLWGLACHHGKPGGGKEIARERLALSGAKEGRCGAFVLCGGCRGPESGLPCARRGKHSVFSTHRQEDVMGMFDFIKEAGEKLVRHRRGQGRAGSRGADASAEKVDAANRAAGDAIEAYIRKMGLDATG